MTIYELFISGARKLSPAIDEYVAGERYLTDAESLDEITTEFVFNRTMTQMCDELFEMGIEVEGDLRFDAACINTVLVLRAIFDMSNFKQRMRDNETLRDELLGILENGDYREDNFCAELVFLLHECYPLSTHIQMLNMHISYYSSNVDFVDHIQAILHMTEDVTHASDTLILDYHKRMLKYVDQSYAHLELLLHTKEITEQIMTEGRDTIQDVVSHILRIMPAAFIPNYLTSPIPLYLTTGPEPAEIKSYRVRSNFCLDKECDQTASLTPLQNAVMAAMLFNPAVPVAENRKFITTLAAPTSKDCVAINLSTLLSHITILSARTTGNL